MAQTASSAEQAESLESILDSMTPSELRVLSLIASGASDETIATIMIKDIETIDIENVGSYVTSIFSQLQIAGNPDYDQRTRAAFLYWEMHPEEKKQLQDRLFANARIEPLTSKEYRVYDFMAQGYSNACIAGRLSLNRIDKRDITNIYGKLYVNYYKGSDPRVMAMLMFDMVPQPNGSKPKGPNLVQLGRK